MKGSWYSKPPDDTGQLRTSWSAITGTTPLDLKNVGHDRENSKTFVNIAITIDFKAWLQGKRMIDL
jgi:hypothetical protein